MREDCGRGSSRLPSVGLILGPPEPRPGDGNQEIELDTWGKVAWEFCWCTPSYGSPNKFLTLPLPYPAPFTALFSPPPAIQ